MNKRKIVQVGDELHLDNGLEGLVVKEILIYHDEPLVFAAENNKQEKYIFSLIENTGTAVTWLATRINSEAKEVNAYDIYKNPLDGYVYKVHLFTYQLISKVLPKYIDDDDLADKDVTYQIDNSVDKSLENEIKLTDNQIKLILEAFEIKHNEIGLISAEEKLIAKLKDCIYGC